MDYDDAVSIQELPVQSAIVSPTQGDTVYGDKHIAVQGYAYSGGGRKVVRVDVSSDGGASWHTASFDTTSETPMGQKAWSWRPWSIDLPIAAPQGPSAEPIEIICKAVDEAYNVQPDTMQPIFNVRGVLVNAWHRVQVQRGTRENASDPTPVPAAAA